MPVHEQRWGSPMPRAGMHTRTRSLEPIGRTAAVERTGPAASDLRARCPRPVSAGPSAVRLGKMSSASVGATPTQTSMNSVTPASVRASSSPPWAPHAQRDTGSGETCRPLLCGEVSCNNLVIKAKRESTKTQTADCHHERNNLPGFILPKQHTDFLSIFFLL